jgi:hypothetical protein
VFDKLACHLIEKTGQIFHEFGGNIMRIQNFVRLEHRFDFFFFFFDLLILIIISYYSYTTVLLTLSKNFILLTLLFLFKFSPVMSSLFISLSVELVLKNVSYYRYILPYLDVHT